MAILRVPLQSTFVPLLPITGDETSNIQKNLNVDPLMLRCTFKRRPSFEVRRRGGRGIDDRFVL